MTRDQFLFDIDMYLEISATLSPDLLHQLICIAKSDSECLKKIKNSGQLALARGIADNALEFKPWET